MAGSRGSASVRRANAEANARKRKITKGQSLSARRPGVIETIYDYLDKPFEVFHRAVGADPRTAYQESKKVSGGIEGLLSPQSFERTFRGTGNADDYLNVGLTLAPFAAKPIGRLLKTGVKAATPKVVQKGAKAATKYAARPSYLGDKAAVKYVREGKAADRALAQGQGALSTVAETAPAAAPEPRVVFPTPAAAAPAEPTGVIAYHGSPHSFDRFDISKIGTGEGAQSYGHGLYFAEAEPVAQEYRQRLAQVTAAPFDRIGIPPSEWNAATMFARQMDPTMPDVAARDFAQWVGRDVTPELVDAFRVAKQPGSMYQVRINADPIKFLDWDKPYEPDALEALAANFDSVDPVMRRTLEDWAYENSRRGIPMPDGQDIISKFGGVTGTNARALSETLKNAGIPGIKYLDQGSRGAGKGSSNYVVFDDALIDLLRKYAMGGAVTKGGI